MMWRSSFGGSDAWHARWSLRRAEVGIHVYRHRSRVSSDRWVFQPWFIYDRKRAAARYP